MRFTTTINIFITAALVILGSILGGNLHNKLHVFWLSILILYAVIIQILYNKIKSQEAELKAERDKITAFMIKKENTNHSVIQCSLFPRNNGARIIKQKRVSVEIFTNSAVSIQNYPELKFTIDKECTLYINNKSLPCTKYAGKYEFYLTNALVSSWENRYFKYSFEVEFHNIGDHIFKIEANNGQYIYEVSNSIAVVSR